MELLFVILVVLAAAAYVVRSLYKQFTGKSGCSGGCSSCSQAGGEQQAENLKFKID